MAWVTRIGPMAVVVCLALPLGGAAAAEDARWSEIKEMLFAERTIEDAAGVIELDAPYRAYDAAIVPITIKATAPQTADRYVKSIHLVIDQNPAPLAAVFHLGPDNGDATIATRVRVNEYTHVRAIAETNDGRLYMAAKYVKAAGGCSAPSLKDHDRAMARLGKMRLKHTVRAGAGAPNQAQILISHPNYSGLQFDQISRNFIPPHYLETIRISYRDRTILTVDGDISLSEDPSIHFFFVPDGPGDIEVEAVDTEGMTFKQRWPITLKADS
jgi:sulfur-oxidizing protein SoxY